jgi:hypothetical protein
VRHPAGNCYFLGTGGFFRIKAGTQTIENLSVNKMDAFFAQIPKSHNVQMAWDRDNKGCWIFATPYHLPRNDDHERHLLLGRSGRGLLPDGLPVPATAPSVCVFDGDTTTARYLVLGGRDGQLRRKYDETVRTDDGTVIYSYVQFAPFRPGGNGQGTLTELEFYLGETGTLANFTVLARWASQKDAYNAFAQPLRIIAGTFGPGRNKPLRQRLTGGAFILSLSNQTLSDHWSMEEIYARSSRRGGSGNTP